MNNKLNIVSKLDFNDIDLTPPNEVIRYIIDELEEETNTIICGKILRYNGQIVSYTDRGILSTKLDLGIGERHVDIQTKLGEQGDINNKFEFYLYTPLHKHYKYRICYLEYGISNYPVKLVLEQSIADDVFMEKNANYIITRSDRTALEELIINILNSKRVIKVMQELIRINQIQREAEKKVQIDGVSQTIINENINTSNSTD